MNISRLEKILHRILSIFVTSGFIFIACFVLLAVLLELFSYKDNKDYSEKTNLDRKVKSVEYDAVFNSEKWRQWPKEADYCDAEAADIDDGDYYGMKYLSECTHSTYNDLYYYGRSFKEYGANEQESFRFLLAFAKRIERHPEMYEKCLNDMGIVTRTYTYWTSIAEIVWPFIKLAREKNVKCARDLEIMDGKWLHMSHDE